MKVGEQREVNMIMFCIGLMAPRAVHRNAENLGTIVLKFRADLVVKCDLIAANRAPVGRVKRKNDPLAS
jgi:hypothetical protein